MVPVHAVTLSWHPRLLRYVLGAVTPALKPAPHPNVSDGCFRNVSLSASSSPLPLTIHVCQPALMHCSINASLQPVTICAFVS